MTAVTELLWVGWATVGAIIDRVVGEARQHLTGRQQAKLAWVAKVNRRLYRAYLLKEQLRTPGGSTIPRAVTGPRSAR